MFVNINQIYNELWEDLPAFLSFDSVDSGRSETLAVAPAHLPQHLHPQSQYLREDPFVMESSTVDRRLRRTHVLLIFSPWAQGHWLETALRSIAAYVPIRIPKPWERSSSGVYPASIA